MKKPVQSDLSLDRSLAPRRYVLVDQGTGQCGTDRETTPDVIERENFQFAADGDNRRWEVFGEEAAA